MNGSHLLEVENLSISYRNRNGQVHRAIDHVSFGLRAGEMLAILGESGSGKSTVALAAAGMLAANARLDSGLIYFRGASIFALPERELRRIRGRHIAVMYQEPASALNPFLKVGDQVAEVLRSHFDIRGQALRSSAEEAMRLAGLSDVRRFYASYPHELSGGQRQRAVLAQALCCRPALLIADEPTTSLDTVTQAELLLLFKKLRTDLGLSIIMVTHDPTTLTGLADRVIVMYAGSLVEESRFTELATGSRHPYTKHLLASIPDPWHAAQSPASNPVPRCAPATGLPVIGCPFEPKCPNRTLSCRTTPPPEIQLEGGGRVRCLLYGG